MIQFISHLGLAFFLGAIVGLERQWRQRVAGLRTNTLVAVGAALFMLLAIRIGGQGVARIASYIVSGVGFIGAGVIMKDGTSIRGLNTAATLWCTAAIGAFCGLGYVYEPIIGTFFIVGVHFFFRPVSNWLRRNSSRQIEAEEYQYQFTIECSTAVENHIRVLLVQYIANNDKLLLSSLSSRDLEDDTITEIEAVVSSYLKQEATMEKIASFLTLEHGVQTLKWRVNSVIGED